MKQFLILVISFYQNAVSPIIRQLFGDTCRFSPTCSEFTKQSVEKYGMIKGVRLGLKQLLSCHPFGK